MTYDPSGGLDVVPDDARAAALEAALETVRDVLASRGYHVDYLARCELLDVELERALASYGGDEPGGLVH